MTHDTPPPDGPDASAPARAETPPTRADTTPLSEAALDAGLRFLHVMEVQGRVEQRYAAVEISALVDLLIGKGVISSRELEDRRERARKEQEAREEKQAFPRLGPPQDKYQVESPPIPCEDNLALCKGACCRLVFHLSMQDLDEGVVRWKYDEPYRIRHDADGYCTHWRRGPGGGCEVYAQRPAVCRSYDCRKDARIWVDYDRREPSELVRKLLPLAR